MAFLPQVFPTLPFVRNLALEIIKLFKLAASRTLAPLRRILTREMVVHKRQRIGTPHPSLFTVVDHLDCGHFYIDHLWSFLDLLCAYDALPHVTARRRRCRPCAALIAAKKPVASVGVSGVAVAL